MTESNQSFTRTVVATVIGALIGGAALFGIQQYFKEQPNMQVTIRATQAPIDVYFDHNILLTVLFTLQDLRKDRETEGLLSSDYDLYLYLRLHPLISATITSDCVYDVSVSNEGNIAISDAYIVMPKVTMFREPQDDPLKLVEVEGKLEFGTLRPREGRRIVAYAEQGGCYNSFNVRGVTAGFSSGVASIEYQMAFEDQTDVIRGALFIVILVAVILVISMVGSAIYSAVFGSADDEVKKQDDERR